MPLLKSVGELDYRWQLSGMTTIKPKKLAKIKDLYQKISKIVLTIEDNPAPETMRTRDTALAILNKIANPTVGSVLGVDEVIKLVSEFYEMNKEIVENEAIKMAEEQDQMTKFFQEVMEENRHEPIR